MVRRKHPCRLSSMICLARTVPAPVCRLPMRTCWRPNRRAEPGLDFDMPRKSQSEGLREGPSRSLVLSGGNKCCQRAVLDDYAAVGEIDLSATPPSAFPANSVRNGPASYGQKLPNVERPPLKFDAQKQTGRKPPTPDVGLYLNSPEADLPKVAKGSRVRVRIDRWSSSSEAEPPPPSTAAASSTSSAPART